MKSKELKAYNLPTDSFYINDISAKPTVLFLILVFIGLYSLFFETSSIYSFVIIGIGLGCIFFTPRVVLMEFYNDYLVLYNKADKNTCTIVYYEEVASWYYERGASRDFLVIELSDGTKEVLEAFSKTIFEVNMSRFLKDKHVKSK